MARKPKFSFQILFMDDRGKYSKKAIFYSVNMIVILLLAITASILYFLGKIDNLTQIATLLSLLAGVASGTYVAGKFVDNKGG